jgi:predicted membrane chloride channel (bestrophin family)
MLLYHNRGFKRILFNKWGSVFFRSDCLFLASLQAMFAAVLQYMIMIESVWAPRLPHHYGLHALGVIVSFAVVFRTNLGWARYWEAITQLHLMYSKWADAYMQVSAFATAAIEAAQRKQTLEGFEKSSRLDRQLMKVEQHFTVMSALSAERLAHGDCQRMEKRCELGAPFSKQIALRRELRHEDFTGARALPTFRADDSGSHQEPCVEQKWNDMEYNVSSIPTERESEVLTGATDRVQVVMYWLLHSLVEMSKDLDIAPPIQSRMYQELSNGMLGLTMAVKIADVPFPFPYAQLLLFMLLSYIVFIPMYVVVFTESMVVGPLLSALIFHTIWCMNETAKELENPFGTDINDISLVDFHSRFLDVIFDVDTAHKCLVEDTSKENKDKEPVQRLGKSRKSEFPSKSERKASTISFTSTNSISTNPGSSKAAEPLSPRSEDVASVFGALIPNDDSRASVLSMAPVSKTMSLPVSQTKSLPQISPTASPMASQALKECAGAADRAAGGASAALESTLATKASPAGDTSGVASSHSSPDLLLESDPMEVVDMQLRKISSRMEEHLGRIARDIEVVAHLWTADNFNNILQGGLAIDNCSVPSQRNPARAQQCVPGTACSPKCGNPDERQQPQGGAERSRQPDPPVACEGMYPILS